MCLISINPNRFMAERVALAYELVYVLFICYLEDFTVRPEQSQYIFRVKFY